MRSHRIGSVMIWLWISPSLLKKNQPFITWRNIFLKVLITLPLRWPTFLHDFSVGQWPMVMIWWSWGRGSQASKICGLTTKNKPAPPPKPTAVSHPDPMSVPPPWWLMAVAEATFATWLDGCNRCLWVEFCPTSFIVPSVDNLIFLKCNTFYFSLKSLSNVSLSPSLWTPQRDTWGSL